MNQIHLDVVVGGVVQGVGFRAGALHKAKSLGITGWAENTSDGQVVMAVEGDEEKVNLFLSWCREGTMLSKVNRVTTSPGKIEGYPEFSIRKN